VQVVEKIYDQPIAQAFGLQEGQLVISIHAVPAGWGTKSAPII